MRIIDADALKKDIARLHVLNDEAEIRRAYEYNPHVTSTDFEETLVSVFDAIDDAPSMDIEPKRGEWIEPKNEVAIRLNQWICSECNYLIDGKHNFCPNCGADMRNCSEKPNNCEDEPHAEIPEYAEWKEPFEKMTDCPWK